ncbi:glycosyltransferase [Desulfoluna spongiiphila]|uniref:glycosyltransferase n=1 Tax=Desulfoluna spongiiphila TaxID=419481 RepID=UPI0012596CDE|nr:glycosyltransferase [Desulfoluna spongiiphila]VVS90563.1 nucleotide-diphospho-sugar transferases [Desulfoluna spongiiphila]
MKITLIISTYNRSDFLEIVLSSVFCQSYKDFDVIIAEDGNNTEVKEVVDSYKSRESVSITHLTQQDKGFRKCRILNRAVASAAGKFLVFIDGDCALHPHFISEYAKRSKDNVCLFGRRVMLGKSFTDKLMNRERTTKQMNMLSIVCSDSKRKENSIYLPFRFSFKKHGIVGSNFCVSKENILKINGFDEDFESACLGEDTDIERRLRLAGVGFRSTKFNTIQYHLHHAMTDRIESYNKSFGVYAKKLKQNSYWCLNGLIKKKESL